MEPYPYFPMFVDLSKKRILVAGAGRIASRRIQTLTQFWPCITVIAPDVVPEVEKLAKDGKVILERRSFQMEDLERADLAVFATDDEQLNAAAGEQCRRRGIPVNVSSDKDLCDFYFPGIVRRDPLVIGVSASGEDHELAAKATKYLKMCLISQEADCS